VFHVKHPPRSGPPQDVEQRLRILVGLIERWSPRIQLVSPGDLPLVWQRHVRDSLQLTPLMPKDLTRAVDIGSGAGFPGLVLAIATNVPFDLIESDRRKAAFLREAAHHTAAPVRIHAARAEVADAAPARLVTARALAPLDRLLGLAAPLLAPNGACLFPKGRGAEAEVAEARKTWHFHVEHHPSHTSPEGQILRITDLAHV